jgi:hypothetical protein
MFIHEQAVSNMFIHLLHAVSYLIQEKFFFILQILNLEPKSKKIAYAEV